MLDHEYYMREALRLARAAAAEGETQPLCHHGALPHVRRGDHEQPGIPPFLRS